MGYKTGVWIDLNKAVIVHLNAKETLLKTIKSGIESKPREEGEKNESGRFGKQVITLEKTKEHKLQHEINDFLKTVIKGIKSPEELVIFGPAKMKLELQKQVKKSATLKKALREVITADSMTDNQTKAWVKKYFNS